MFAARPSTHHLQLGAVAGLGHILLTGLLMQFLHGGVDTGVFFDSDLTIFFWSYTTLLGTFLMGAVPVTYYLHRNAVLPIIIVGGLLLLAGYLTYQALQGPAVWIGPTPLLGYLLLWFVILPFAMFVGYLEVQFRGSGPERWDDDW